jgi:PadR family transcriptional regulator AphA
MAREADVSSEPVLLGLLMAQPRHGYELYREFSRELGRVWRIGLSQLYAQLRQLEAEGLLTAQAESQATRPSRKIYHLTPAGQEAFLDWVHQPSRHIRHIRLEFLARLYFFRRLALPGLEKLVAAQKAVCQAQVEALAGSTVETDDAFGRLVIEFRQGQLRAIIHWLDRCLETL